MPLELGCCQALLERAGHEVLLLDGALMGADNAALATLAAAFAPAMTVVTTAPTYLFWRCAQPELRVPRDFLVALGRRGGATVGVGPHGSATPQAALRKLGCDMVVRGECEEVIVALANARGVPDNLQALCFARDGEVVIIGGPAATRFTDLPALRWPTAWIARHQHHHHRFGTEAPGPGRRWKLRAGAPIAAHFVPRSIIAISIADGIWRRCSMRLMG